MTSEERYAYLRAQAYAFDEAATIVRHARTQGRDLFDVERLLDRRQEECFDEAQLLKHPGVLPLQVVR